MNSEKAILTLYNSMTRKEEPFTPMDESRVTMYNCGPTVYSYAHIGNARAAVVADVLFRVLRHIYGADAVIYARNITDIDDKIIKAAQDTGQDISDITQKYAKIYNDDLAALGCLSPTIQPWATQAIDEMAALITTLLDKDYAYIAKDHVLFDVTKDVDYGKLSGRKHEDNLSGARVEVADYKRNPGDFVLWKPSKAGEPSYAPSKRFPPGRPGWHIECSAMVRKELGETIDIHCGGIDLKFPHHENEIAQSECANDKTFARYWVHNEFLNMVSKDGASDKMSKSLGNIVLIHDLLKDWDGEVIRLALLKAHYRSELSWSEALLEESKAQLDRWYTYLRDIDLDAAEALDDEPDYGYVLINLLNDLHTPLAISDGIQNSLSSKNANKANWLEADIGSFEYIGLLLEARNFKASANLLGLLNKSPEDWFQQGVDKTKFDQLVADYDAVREAALAAKASGDKIAMSELFKQSDAIRDELLAEGITIETGPDGSSWSKA